MKILVLLVVVFVAKLGNGALHFFGFRGHSRERNGRSNEMQGFGFQRIENLRPFNRFHGGFPGRFGPPFPIIERDCDHAKKTTSSTAAVTTQNTTIVASQPTTSLTITTTIAASQPTDSTISPTTPAVSTTATTTSASSAVTSTSVSTTISTPV